MSAVDGSKKNGTTAVTHLKEAKLIWSLVRPDD
jgi:hypothetical protein